MNCAEVEKRLADLLDSTFTGYDNARALEEHIAACWRCREERDNLMECRRLVAALPVLEPPPGFITRVMAGVREEAIRPSLRQWLFSLVTLKSPMRATALVLIGILSLYVYQKGDRDKAPTLSHLLDRSASQPGAARDSETLPTAAVETSREDSNRAKGAAKSMATNLPQNRLHRERAEPTISAKPLPANGLEQAAENRRRIPIPAQNVFSSRDGVQRASDTPAFAVPPSQEMLRAEDLPSLPLQMDRALTGMSQPTADYEFVVRRRSAARRDAPANGASASLSRRAQRLEASSANEKSELEQSAGSFTANPVIEVRWYSVWPHHYQQFKNDLANESIIESETALANKENEPATKPDRQLMIKVVILSSGQ